MLLYIFSLIALLIIALIYGYVFMINKNLRIKFWGIFSLITIGLLITVFIFNLSFDRFRKNRVDLTVNKSYTISNYTAQIMKNLRTPVKVTYYVTAKDKMNTMMKNLERDIRDKFEEMRIASGNKFVYKIVNPEANSKLAEKLARKKIRPRKVQSIESDEWSLKLAYSSIEISYLQQEPEIIEFLGPNDINNLEYELASRIYKLSYGADTTDYSDNTLFTIEAAKQHIYPKINGQIILYYLDTIAQNTANLPEKLSGVREKIINKLDEISRASGGKILFQKPDPKTTQQLFFVLGRKGLLEGVPLTSSTAINIEKSDEENKKDKENEKKVYSAIYMNLFQKSEATIPLVSKDNLNTVEMEIHKKILKKLNKKKPKIAIYSPRKKLTDEEKKIAMQMRQLDKIQDSYSTCSKLLQQGNYDIIKTDISKESPIPADAKTLIVLSPDELNERQVYEIEKFIHSGRNIIIAHQKYKFEFSPDPKGGFTVVPKKTNSKLEDMLNHYGMKLDEKVLMDKNMEVLTISVKKPANWGGFRVMQQSNELVKTPLQIKVNDSNFNHALSFGNRIQRLLFFGGSRFKMDREKLKQAGIDIKEIMWGSSSSWNVDYKGGNIELNPPADKNQYLDKPVLAFLAEGKFSALYKDKTVPLYTMEKDYTEEEKKNLPPYMRNKKNIVPDESTKEDNMIVGDPRDSRILVIGSSDLFKNDFMGDPNHQIFFLNCVDALTLGEDLIHIRSKASIDSSLKPTTDGEKNFWKFFVIGLIPLLFGIIGTFIISLGNIRANA